MSDVVTALVVAVPILGAALTLAAGLLGDRLGWPIAAGVLSVELGLAGWLAWQIYAGKQRLVHVLGGDTFGRKTVEGQEFTVGIELIGDAFSGAVVALIAVVALATLAISRRRGPRGASFYAAYLVLTGGLMGVVLTGDLFNLFVFLEIVGLGAYAVVASGRRPQAAVAALKYLLIGTAGASLYLIGVGYLFVRTGTLNMADISRSLAGDLPWIEGPLYTDPVVLAAFGFIAVGLATKAALFPLHTWQPDAYAEAPDAVSIYIAALVSTAGAYALARVSWFVFTPEFFAATPVAADALVGLAAISIVVGSGLAAVQRRVKRMFAYSSVAQFGLVIAAVGLAVHPDSTAAGVRFAVLGAAIHLLAHALLKGGLFAGATALAGATGARTVAEYAGLAKRRPVAAGAIAVLGIAIVGVPPTVGFVGKWYIAVGAVESGLWPVAVVVLVSTLLTLLYVTRLLEALYFRETDEAVTSAGGVAHDHDRATVATDGGETVSIGAIAVVVGAAVAAVGLGLAGGTLTSLFEPVVDAVQAELPEVTA